MYTGIVQEVGEIVEKTPHQGYVRFSMRVGTDFTSGIEGGASVSVDGVCLTVVAFTDRILSFDATRATLRISNLDDRNIGDRVNMERSCAQGAEIGGHPLAGHVDTTASIHEFHREGGEATLTIKIPDRYTKYVFEKGFLAINGASLTVEKGDTRTGLYTINLIPETLRRTTFPNYGVGARLNIEIDAQTRILVDTLERVVGTVVRNQLTALLSAKSKGADA